MATRYQIRLKNQAGAVIAVLTDWRNLIIKRRLNSIASLSLTLDGDLDIIDSFALDGQIEVWRRDIAAVPAIDWYLEYEGFHRTPVRQYTKDGLSLFTSHASCYNHLLNRRIVLYPAGSAQADKSGVGETVMKEYVDENAGPGATSPPRLLSAGTFTGLTIQADGAAGGNWEGTRQYRNLLDVAKEISDVTAVDFAIVGTGAATFEFQAKASPWGNDRTTVGLDPATGLNAAGNPPVVFALEFGNMALPLYSLARTNEVTAALALGQGSREDRNVVERTSADINDSPWNRCEVSRNATYEVTTNGLNAVADALLEENQARESFTFDVLQIPALLYGRDYFFGDLVTARFKNIERHKKIIGVTIKVDRKGEYLDLELTDVP